MVRGCHVFSQERAQNSVAESSMGHIIPWSILQLKLIYITQCSSYLAYNSISDLLVLNCPLKASESLQPLSRHAYCVDENTFRWHASSNAVERPRGTVQSPVYLLNPTLFSYVGNSWLALLSKGCPRSICQWGHEMSVVFTHISFDRQAYVPPQQKMSPESLSPEARVVSGQ